MADTSFLSSSTKNQTAPISSFLSSPRFFNGFLTKPMFDAENLMSPTSILDSQNSSKLCNPFGYDKRPSKPTNSILEINNKLESEGIGIALIDDKNDGNISKPTSRMVLFGAKLKVKIPSDNRSPSSADDHSPNSPADFGIKTRNSQISSPNSAIRANHSTRKEFNRQISLKEMELSEDYTCVITHGPNPKTTHIFDNCIVESCCSVVKLSESETECAGFSRNVSSPSSPSVNNFLSFCHTCKDILGEGKGIYMYRGEKAFCSHECRCQEMVFQENEES